MADKAEAFLEFLLNLLHRAAQSLLLLAAEAEAQVAFKMVVLAEEPTETTVGEVQRVLELHNLPVVLAGVLEGL
jgi:D-alanine-D-alanine ligase-like ATP-grasp enzyme